jgi:hypothetical protein
MLLLVLCTRSVTEKVGVPVTILNRIRRKLVRNLGWDIDFPDFVFFFVIFLSLKENARIVGLSRLGHARFLPDPFLIFFHLSLCSTLYNLATQIVV